MLLEKRWKTLKKKYFFCWYLCWSEFLLNSAMIFIPLRPLTGVSSSESAHQAEPNYITSKWLVCKEYNWITWLHGAIIKFLNVVRSCAAVSRVFDDWSIWLYNTECQWWFSEEDCHKNLWIVEACLSLYGFLTCTPFETVLTAKLCSENFGCSLKIFILSESFQIKLEHASILIGHAFLLESDQTLCSWTGH